VTLRELFVFRITNIRTFRLSFLRALLFKKLSIRGMI
jgi:hypothetical protein